MKTVIVYKWARDVENAAVRNDGSVDWRNAKMTAGEDDPAALDAAKTIAAASDGQLIGLTIGDGDASWALARGVQQAVSVTDAPFLPDNAATAAVLAAGVRSVGDVDVVVIGDSEQYPGVAATLAGLLGWSALLGVTTATARDGRIEAVRASADGVETVSLAAPAVLGVAAVGAESRTPGMKELLAARKRPVTKLTVADLAVTFATALEDRGTRVPETTPARVFEGDPALVADQLVAALRAEGVLGMNTTWVLATDERGLAAAVAAARGAGGSVSAVVVGSRDLADAVAAAGPDDVLWLLPDDGVPAEAYAAPVAAAAAAADVRVVVSSRAPAARTLLGAAAARLGAAVVPGAVGLAIEGGAVVVERLAIGGAVLETVSSSGPVAVIFAGEDVPSPGADAPVAELPAEVAAADMRVERRESAAAGTSGVRDAARVVSVGRGLKAKGDLAVVHELADTLGAEIACSMPIADDFGWVAKERYIGRSGQHIAPRLYLALGISGTPQHMEGVRDAKVVAAVNNDPKAPVFRTADYGIVGDLYEVVPALIAALKK